MRDLRILGLLGTVLLAGLMTSCKAHRHACEQNAITESVDVVESRFIPAYIFTISFISQGEGIDASLIDSTDAFLSPFEELGLLSVDRISWGREGETDYCVMRIDIGEEASANLKAYFRRMAERNERMFFTEGNECSRK